MHYTESFTSATRHAGAVSASVGHYHDPNLMHRPSMEDEIIIYECDGFPALFVGVYDGHGGCRAAQLLHQLLHRVFLDELLGEELAIPPPPVRRGTPSFDEDLHSACSTPPCDDVIVRDGDTSNEDETATTNGTSTAVAGTPITAGHHRRVLDHPANTPDLDVAAAFRRAYKKMDTILKLRNCVRVGATAVTAFVRRVHGVGRLLTVANCGDSRAVLSRAGRPVALSTDHRPVDSERVRIEESGGFVTSGRVNGMLSVARAFGDHWMKSVVVSTPAITHTILTPLDDFLILACDGLWDFVDEHTVVRLAQHAFDRGLASHQVAELLVKEALEQHSTDNISVVVVQFDMDDE